MILEVWAGARGTVCLSIDFCGRLVVCVGWIVGAEPPREIALW